MAGKIHESRAGKVAAWSALIASFGLSFATWVALAVLAGFDQAVTVWGVTLGVALLMPVAVDGYVVTALALWMADVPESVASFAKKNTYAAAGAGVVAQSIYHCASTYAATHEAWRAWLALAVGALPPAVAALSVHMRAKIRRHAVLAAQAPAAVSVTRTSDIDVPDFVKATATAVASEVPPAAPAGSVNELPHTAIAQQARPAASVSEALEDATDTLAELEAATRDALAAVDTDTDTADDETTHDLSQAAGTVTSQREKRDMGKKLLRNGDSVEDVAAALDVPERTVYRWQSAVRAEGQMAGARS